MALLRLYGRDVTSFFQLMGTSENDITISLAWVLSNCPVLLNSVVRSICHVRKVDFNNVEIACQEYESNKGFTDIEIRDDHSFHIIIEAKRGWNLPGKAQITKYAKRRSFARSKIVNKYIVTLSECTQKYAAKHIPDNAGNGIPVVHRSYQDILNMANQSYSESNNAEKRMLSQFCQYMRGWMTMQTIESNMVYVVSLSKDYADGCDLTYIDIVEKKHIMAALLFHRLSGGSLKLELLKATGETEQYIEDNIYDVERSGHRTYNPDPNYNGIQGLYEIMLEQKYVESELTLDQFTDLSVYADALKKVIAENPNDSFYTDMRDYFKENNNEYPDFDNIYGDSFWNA